ncbi:MAG: VWA domain-containing protein, partial [Micrococcales bacterium]|nr:VWA domain-containing protein [Micrococcales bacterium]
MAGSVSPRKMTHHLRTAAARRRRHTLVAPIVALTFLGGMLGVAASSSAQAAVPAPTSTTAVITVKIGGTRTGPASVDPVQGVVLKLYDGSSAALPASKASPLPDSWATCTSDADGDCSFIIPDTQVGGANRDRQFYIMQVGAPTGWFGDPTVVTSVDGDTFTQTPYAVRTGAELRAGETYRSTSEFMVTDTDATASTGIWPESLDNPAWPESCGLNVALVLDLSYSVEEAHALDTLKGAAMRMTNSLVGTDSQVALFTFGISAPATGAANVNRPLTPVSTQAGADQVNSWIEGMTITTRESTNWDRGLYQVAQQQQIRARSGQKPLYDLVIVLTD